MPHTTLYTIKPATHGEFKVVLIRTGKVAFIGTRSECNEWIERNGNDEWN